ncbi:MAG: DUF3996 domain-containing protein [Deltaproteobacteria bacterium]|nr:DUF3996 domain-containing protein [Deltaproteobacteria bacterium]
MTLRTTVLVALALALTTQTADARRRRSMGGERYASNGVFGLGLELGAPFGLNGKYFLSDDRALNFGVGADGYYYRDRDGLHLYLDYLFHPVSLTNNETFKLPLYVGVGGRIWDFNDNRNEDGLAFGVRVPFGIAFDFNKAPIDVFIQLTFVADFFTRYRDNFAAGLEGSLGIRFWFD